MTYSPDTTILGPSRGDADTICAWAKAKGCARPDEVKRYLDTVYHICPRIGMRAELVVAQSIHETSVDGVPWASSWWRGRLNPAGGGVTGDTGQDASSPRFADGEAAAYYQITHLWLYAVGVPLPTSLSSSSDPRWGAAVAEGYAGVAPNLDGLTGRWAKDPEYADTIANLLNDLDAAGLFGGGVEIPKESTVTTFKRYALPGLPNPAYFPDWLTVEIKLIPSSTPGWTSGQKIPTSNFVSTTWHDTQNDSSSATGEYNWAATGGRAAINSAGSYNGIFDAKKLIIAQRFDELVGHAANPTGNVTSYAFEEAYGAYGHAGAREVGMWVHAGILQSMGKTATAAMYQHNFWSGKNCPKQIRDRGEWSATEKTVDARIAEINQFLNVTTPAPKPPVAIEEVPGLPIDSSPTKGQSIFPVDGTDYILVNDMFTAKKAIKRQKNEKGDTFGDDVKPTDPAFVGAYIYRFKNKETNPWKVISAWKSRFLLDDLERVNDVIPSQE